MNVPCRMCEGAGGEPGGSVCPVCHGKGYLSDRDQLDASEREVRYWRSRHTTAEIQLRNCRERVADLEALPDADDWRRLAQGAAQLLYLDLENHGEWWRVREWFEQLVALGGDDPREAI